MYWPVINVLWIVMQQHTYCVTTLSLHMYHTGWLVLWACRLVIWLDVCYTRNVCLTFVHCRMHWQLHGLCLGDLYLGSGLICTVGKIMGSQLPHTVHVCVCVWWINATERSDWRYISCLIIFMNARLCYIMFIGGWSGLSLGGPCVCQVLVQSCM